MPLNAKLHIETIVKERRTMLKTSFCTPPFKIANITEDKTQHSLHLMLMSSSPGILDGDSYNLQIDVGEGCKLLVETQSYQRLFQMRNGASQDMVVTLRKGSSFCYIPHPMVPHQQARFEVENRIYLHEGCTLLWGEVISCGRKLNDEIFKFSSYHGVSEICLNGKLVVKENIVMRPLETDLTAIGQMEGYTHQATLLFVDEFAAVELLTDTLVQMLKRNSLIAFGVSALPVNGLIVRILGFRAEQLFQLVKTMAATLQEPEIRLFKKQGDYVI